MKNKILDLAKQLIAMRSTFDNPKALEDALDLALSEVKNFTIERFENQSVRSALIYRSKKRPGKFKIILHGHLDVIPGKHENYTAVVKKNKLFGVGSLDMKASVACLIMVFKEIVDKVNYPLGLQLVTDEEIGGFNGTKHQISKGVKADFMITGEPTNLKIANRARGVLHLRISCKGKTAHGAYPESGENAIRKMVKFLNTLNKSFPRGISEKGNTSINLSNIETSNNSYNKIPNDCTVSLDIRFPAEEVGTILQKIKSLTPNDFKVEVVVHERPMFVNEDNKYLIKLQKIAEQLIKKKVALYGANGSSDARHFKGIGIEFGPKGGGIGSDKEYIEIPSLGMYRKILNNFLLSLNR